MKGFDIADFIPAVTENTIINNLMERFKSRRKERKLSQQMLAKNSGVSYASIRRFEQTGEIALRSLVKLANALGCLSDFEELFKHEIITSVRDYKK